MAILQGGRPFYGEALGILMLDMKAPLIPGNVGNATSYDFPVRFKVLETVPSDWWCDAQGPDEKRFAIFIKAARELQEEGVRAITTGCGFYAIFQREVADAVRIPVFTSPLLMVPIVHRMLGGKGRIGILTAGSKNLGPGHFEGVGIEPAAIPLGIVGMEGYDEFRTVILEESKPDVDTEAMEAEVLDAARKLLRLYPDTEAFVFECSDLPPFSRAVQDATGLPVFDFITMIRWVHTAVVQKRYAGFM